MGYKRWREETEWNCVSGFLALLVFLQEGSGPMAHSHGPLILQHHCQLCSLSCPLLPCMAASLCGAFRSHQQSPCVCSSEPLLSHRESRLGEVLLAASMLSLESLSFCPLSGIISHCRYFLGPGDSLLSLLSSSHWDIPVSGWWLSGRLFLWCLLLHHLPDCGFYLKIYFVIFP